MKGDSVRSTTPMIRPQMGVGGLLLLIRCFSNDKLFRQ